MNPTSHQNRRILVIDDNRAIHEDFKKILCHRKDSPQGIAEFETALFGKRSTQPANEDFEIDSAFQGHEGLIFVKKSLKENRPYAMAFVDVRMPPGWDGIETTAKIWEIDPNLQIVICTAYSDYSWDETTAKLGISDRLVILKKPFDNIEVVQLAHALAEKWSLAQQASMKMDQLNMMVEERTQELQKANERLKLEMAERARTEDILRQAQKMEALGQLAGGVAHDFNNLLTVIRGYTDFLIEIPGRDPDMTDALHEIRHASDRAAKLIAQMLMFSRKKPVQRQDLDLNEIIARMENLLQRLLGENISVEIQPVRNRFIVHADQVMMEQIVLNLAVNARDAMPRGGRLTIQTGEVEIKENLCGANPKARPGRFVCLKVSDTGSGIPPEIIPRLFEPFFTTKSAGKGTGIGLATVFGIVEQHEGWIDVESQPGNGACFKIFLPLKSTAPDIADIAQRKARVPGGKETILLVEDEKLVRQLAGTILHRHGYRVYEAGTETEALSIWNDHPQDIDLLLTDVVLPGSISGYELAKNLLTRKKQLKVAYMTGYGTDFIDPGCILQEGLNFLAKPYSPERLLLTVRSCLDEPSEKNGN